MDYSNRVSFQKTWEMPARDEYPGTEPDAIVWHHHLMCGGSISVQHRMTGFGYRDEETAYTSPCGAFWLATGHVDIRDCMDEFDTEEGMIQWVIDRANTCTGRRSRGYGRTLAQLEARNNWKPRP